MVMAMVAMMTEAGVEDPVQDSVGTGIAVTHVRTLTDDVATMAVIMVMVAMVHTEAAADAIAILGAVDVMVMIVTVAVGVSMGVVDMRASHRPVEGPLLVTAAAGAVIATAETIDAETVSATSTMIGMTLRPANQMHSYQLMSCARIEIT